MFEANNGSVSVPDLTSAINIIEAKDKEITRLSNQLEFLAADITRKFNDNKAAASHLEAYIEAEDIEVEEGSDLEALCDLLGVDLTEEVEVKLTMTYSGTINVRKGTQAWELSSDWPHEMGVTLDGATLGEVTYDDTTVRYI